MSLSTKSSHVNFSSPFSFSINWEKKKSIFFIFLFLLDFSKAFITRFEILGFIRNSLWRFYLAFHVGSFIWLLSVIRLHIQWYLFCLIMFEFGDLNFFFAILTFYFSFLSKCSSGHQISCSSSYTQSLKLKNLAVTVIEKNICNFCREIGLFKQRKITNRHSIEIFIFQRNYRLLRFDLIFPFLLSNG